MNYMKLSKPERNVISPRAKAKEPVLHAAGTVVPHISDAEEQLSCETPDSTQPMLMGPLLKHDFSNVRIHTDRDAAKAAERENAAAYTTGNEIFFGKGQYLPSTRTGKALLAHELTHVVQAENAKSNSLAVRSPVAELEREADSVATDVASGRTLSPIVGVAMGNLPLRAGPPPKNPTLEDAPTFGNILQDEPKYGSERKIVELREEEDVWYQFGEYGKSRARGSYDFVVKDNKIFAIKGGNFVRQYGHTEAAAGERVSFAGQVRFGGEGGKPGTLVEWSNTSGHYAPPRAFAENAVRAGLPKDKFVPYTGPKEKVGLPVVQPRNSAGSSPKAAGDGEVAPINEGAAGAAKIEPHTATAEIKPPAPKSGEVSTPPSTKPSASEPATEIPKGATKPSVSEGAVEGASRAGVTEGAVEGAGKAAAAEGAVAGGAAEAEAASVAARVAGFALEAAAGLVIGIAVGLFLEWLKGAIEEAILKSDLEALRPNIEGKLQELSPKIKGLQERNSQVYSRVTIDVTRRTGTTIGGEGGFSGFGSWDHYEGVALLGVDVAGDTAPHQRSEREERLSANEDRQHSVESFSALIDDPPKRKREAETKKALEQLRTAKPSKPAAPPPAPASQPQPKAFTPLPMPAPPSAPSVQFLAPPGGPSQEPRVEDLVAYYKKRALGLKARGEQLLSSSPSKDAIAAFVNDESIWRNEVTIWDDHYIDKGPDYGHRGMDELRNSDEYGGRLMRIRLILPG